MSFSFLLFIGIVLFIILAFTVKSKSASPNNNNASSKDNASPQKSSSLTPEDVVNKRFQPTKFREGYEQDSVDDFLDRAVVEFRRLKAENELLHNRNNNPESVPVSLGVPTLSPEDVINQTFKPTKFSEGYDQDQVDDYLDEIVLAFRYWASENQRLNSEIAGNIQ